MNRSRLVFAGALALLLTAYALVYLPALRDAQGRVGPDYAYVLPRLLAGDFWFERNGLFAIPWFSPAFGAGLPFYAHPASAYVSLPQALSFVFDPLLSVEITLFVCVATAFASTWWLLRRVFVLQPASALFGASVFALNGFHAARMQVGHLGFHSSVLAPLIACLLLRPLPELSRARRWRTGLDGALAGLALAYLFQSGNVYGIPAVLLGVCAIALLAAIAGKSTRGFVPRAGIAALVALCLCAAKLQAALDYLASFPRTGYGLPGARDAWQLARVLFSALFLAPPHELGTREFVGQTFALGKHEWDYSVGFVPALVILAAGALWILRARTSWSRRQLVRFGLLLLTLAIPFVLNLHGAAWTSFLKSLPIAGSSSSFVRLLFAYVPFVAVLAALACERLRPARWPDAPALVALALAVFVLASTDRGGAAEESYSPRAVVEAWHARSPASEIHAVVAPPVVNGERHLGNDRDDALTRGASQLLCYEPLFGYRLEWFPRSSVHPGDPFEARGAQLNFHDPRSFLDPERADARPGSTFDERERDELARFLRYEPLETHWTTRQRIANALNLLALAAVPLFLALACLRLRACAREAGAAARI